MTSVFKIVFLNTYITQLASFKFTCCCSKLRPCNKNLCHRAFIYLKRYMIRQTKLDVLLISANHKIAPHFYFKSPRRVGLNVSTALIMAMKCRQCLPLSVVQLKCNHSGNPHCRNFVDTLQISLGQMSNFESQKLILPHKWAASLKMS